jgi:hypothetical protein
MAVAVGLIVPVALTAATIEPRSTVAVRQAGSLAREMPAGEAEAGGDCDDGDQAAHGLGNCSVLPGEIIIGGERPPAAPSIFTQGT